MKGYSYIFALVFLLLNSITATSIFFNSTTDQEALVAFKNSITSDPDGILSNNWTNDSPLCHWIGVSCGIKHQRVTVLNISGFDLVGTVAPHLGNLTFLRYLDISSNNFTGSIPSELSKLRRLRWTDFGVNSFTGQVPSWLGTLPQLEELYLYNNTFSGRIPPSLFNNSKLQILSVSFNVLSGNIPEEIGNSSSLKGLYLDYNQLSGSIPYGIFNISSMTKIYVMFNSLTGRLPSNMCNNIPNLKTLALSGNQLSGQIPPNIYKCRDLEGLSLSYNHFNSNIPSEIGSLSMLRMLYLGINDFKGGIPAEIGNLSHLEILYLVSASLTGRIPKEIGHLTSLEVLFLLNNNLEGEVPQELGNLLHLERFSVFNNSLSGNLPHSMFNNSAMKMLDVSFNQFSGGLPSSVDKFSLSNLEELYLGTNRFSGKIPSFIANATKLTILGLEDNAFSGPVPDFGNLRGLKILSISENQLTRAESPTKELEFLLSLTNCRYLEHLVISNNPFNGILPNSVGNLSTSLQVFHASRCNIKGVIPSKIGNLNNLIELFLSNNQMTRSIPTSIWNLKKLERLHLQQNQLQGQISIHICRMSKLGELWLDDNMLTGPMPECLDELTSLRSIYLSYNKLNSTIPSHFWNLRDLLILNLSSNNLSGRLPPQIGNLRAIYELDLSSNQFLGDIPSVIDNCKSLQFLSLSNNKFTGSIPKSLENLPLLRDFNVSYNQLEGEIPSGGCFANFTAQSFVHNSALCGATRFQVPSCSKNHGASKSKSNGSLMKYIVPSFILATILAIIVVMLIRRQKKKKIPLPIENSPGIEWRRITYLELERATTSFSESSLLGRGSFGTVFKGTLSDGLNIAAKVFNLQLEEAVKSFDTESKILSNIRHRNLVRIIGCCSNMEFKALILAYMPNGSLEKWLYSDTCCLDIVQRLNVAIDVALAMEYLHHGHTFPVVHCDIKPSNILLDEDMMAHVGDFGIAKLFDNGEAMIQTKTLATIGYAAPEYGMEGQVSTNGDVYSYGIMLLEMFTGKKPTNDMFGGEMSLKEWVIEALQRDAIIEVFAPGLLSTEDEHFSTKQQCVLSIFELAMKCLVVSPEERINMKEAGALLHNIKGKVIADIMPMQRRPYAAGHHQRVLLQ